MRVKLDPNASVRLRKGVFPTIFDCQPDRKRSHSKHERAVILKRQKVENLKEILQTKSDDETCRYENESVTDQDLLCTTNVNIGNCIAI